ncbi:C-X-C chemokine receptor type 5 [Podarcis lilfordi]|uniref:C-X-C chemokine receptor type 5 n=1 Tax=Podarcis lilfordi TaxID=74358 RepID=A0AA35LG97_9SAUR|nr:C-X-C chemokine receptor type 5 [Podarcis lilfordi]
MVDSQVIEMTGISIDNFMLDDYNTSDYAEQLSNYTDYMCPTMDESTTQQLRAFLVPFVYMLIFLLGGVGNLMVIVILWCYRRSRSSTELFLFHLALANLLLVFTFPFGVVQNIAGWIFGPFLCKVLSATNRINFYSSSLLLGCISVERYLAVVHALWAFQKQRAISVHLTCLGVWVISLLLTLPDLLFTEVWPSRDNQPSICHFREYGKHGINAWLATRFLYHIVGFFLPSLVMCFCYIAIVRVLCRSQRLKRQKVVRVAILVTSVFLFCWTPYHVVIFLDTLNKLATANNGCAVELNTAIILSEMVAFSHCCLNPILYAFVGIRFRHDACRLLNSLGCLSQSTLQDILGTCRMDSSTAETNISLVNRHPSSPSSTNPLTTFKGSPSSSSCPQAPADQRAQGGESGAQLRPSQKQVSTDQRLDEQNLA